MSSKILALCFLSATLGFTSSVTPINSTYNLANEEIKVEYDTLYEDVISGVVSVKKYLSSGTSIGSGWIYKIDEKKDEMYIVTNNHVVESGQSFEVHFYDEKKVEAKLVGYDSALDVAVLKTKFYEGYKEQVTGNSWYTKPGEEVFAIGNPKSLEYKGTITRGIVAGKNRSLPVDSNSTFFEQNHMLQIDLAVNPGNSGGPLFNVMNQVIGMNTLKYTNSYGTSFEGLNFAIPVNNVLIAVKSIIENGRFIRATMGNALYVNVNQISLTDRALLNIPEEVIMGAFVSSVDLLTPMHNAGITKNSIITEFNGWKVENIAMLCEFIYYCKPNDVVPVKFYKFNNGSYELSEVNITLKAN